MFGKRGRVRFRENVLLYLGLFLVVFAAFGVMQSSITGFVSIDECVDTDGDTYTQCDAEEVDAYGISAITSATSDQGMPKIYDGMVFYESSDGTQKEIVYYDFSTESSIVLNADDANDVGVDVGASGAHTWMNNKEGDFDIWYSDLIGNVDTIASDVDGEVDMYPNIYAVNNEIVWQKKTVDYGWDIWYYDGASSYALFEEDGDQLRPVITQDGVYYEGSDGQIKFTDFSVISDVSKGSGTKKYIDAEGGNLVWQTNVNGNWDVVLYSLRQGNSIWHTDDESQQRNPRISGDLVVWADNRNGNWDIYAYDKSTEVETQITSHEGNQIMPDTDGDYIVWQDERNGNQDIYYVQYSLLNADEGILFGDCDPDDATIYPGAEEVCEDGVDNDCDGSVDEDCSCTDETSCGEGYVCTDGVCVTEEADTGSTTTEGTVTEDVACLLVDSGAFWADFSLGELTVVGEGDEVLGYVYGDGTCTDESITFYVYSVDDGTYTLLESGVGTVENYADEGYDLVYYVFNIDWDETDTNYLFTVGEIESSELMVCETADTCTSSGSDTGDTTDTTDTTDTGSTELNYGCLYDGIDSNGWTDWSSFINVAVEGDTVSTFSYGDGTCEESATVYVYGTYIGDDGNLYTDSTSVETLTGTVYYEETEGLDQVYADWTASGADTYYYFITVVGNGATYSDAILVCSDDTCTSESYIPADAYDYAAAYSVSETTEETTDTATDEETYDYSDDTDTSSDDGSFSCEDQWDCSGVSWSDCVSGVKTLDLSECVFPTEEDCLLEENWPEYEKSCVEEEDDTDVEYTNEDVPFFTGFNVIMLLGLLVGFYAFRKSY
jgi:beta propeller repeat protein